jgi:hypothetical protein
MVQTLTAWSSGVTEINTGANFLLCNGIPFTDALQTKLDAIGSTISAAGISQIHAEKDVFRQFEHVVSAGQVAENDFGTIVSSADFDWIMQHVDAEITAQVEAAAAAAAAAEVEKPGEAAEAEGASV